MFVILSNALFEGRIPTNSRGESPFVLNKELLC
jgi:hypothetical protein